MNNSFGETLMENSTLWEQEPFQLYDMVSLEINEGSYSLYF